MLDQLHRVESDSGQGGDGGDGAARRSVPAADGRRRSLSRERRSSTVLKSSGLAREAGSVRVSLRVETISELVGRRGVGGSRRGARGVRAAARGAVVRRGARRRARRGEPDWLAREHVGEAGHPARVPVRRHHRRVDGSRPLAVLRQGHAAAEAARPRAPACASCRAARRSATARMSRPASSACRRCT